MFDNQRVKILRESLGLSENLFAKKIGVSQSTYNRFEKGLTSLSAEAIAEIASVFSVDANWLLFGTGGEGPIYTKDKSAESEEIIKLQAKLIAMQEKLLEYQAEEKNRTEKQVQRLQNDH